MNDKDFNSMRRQHMDLLSDGKSKKEPSTIMKLLNFRLTNIKKDPDAEGIDGKPKKEEKTPIWWAIMLFCIVYGIEIVYNALMTVMPPQ